MSIYHILNGDCLAKQLEQSDIEGEIIVCRECLIDGSLQGDSLPQFWTIRAQFISESYQGTAAQYFDHAVTEFEKMIKLPENATIHLWFEDDLFCQANMWFTLSLLAKRKQKVTIFRVFPTVKKTIDHWKGFGLSNAEMLNQSLANKVAFSQKDIALSNALWTAYKDGNFNKLNALSHTKSPCFRFLEEVCQAHIDRFPTDGSLGRPENVIKALLLSNFRDFESVFVEFTKQEGIYGFGDLQVQAIYDRLLDERGSENKVGI